MEGWRPVEDIVRWGFGQAPVVMANEFHSGWARCVRTRVIGARMIRAAHEAGVRRLAMEALHWPARDVPGPITTLPDDDVGYLAQPEMRAMIGTALDLGRLLESAPAEPMLVWCGNGHASKHEPAGCGDDEWIPMGWNFRELSGIDPFVIGQTLADLGGTAGILRAQAPPPLDQRAGVDALVVSTDNELTGEEPPETLLTEDGA